MKYLKGFSESIMGLDDSQLWEFIDVNIFLERKDKHGADELITERDKEEIIKCCKDTLKIINPIHINPIQLYSGTDRYLEINILNHVDKFVETIYKSPDEWFYVSEDYYSRGKNYDGIKREPYSPYEGHYPVWVSYYKCDSIDGLIKFIKDRHEYLCSHKATTNFLFF